MEHEESCGSDKTEASETIARLPSAARRQQASEVRDWEKPYKATSAHALQQHRTATERRDAWKRGETWKGPKPEDSSFSSSEGATLASWNEQRQTAIELEILALC